MFHLTKYSKTLPNGVSKTAREIGFVHKLQVYPFKMSQKCHLKPFMHFSLKFINRDQIMALSFGFYVGKVDVTSLYLSLFFSLSVYFSLFFSSSLCSALISRHSGGTQTDYQTLKSPSLSLLTLSNGNTPTIRFHFSSIKATGRELFLISRRTDQTNSRAHTSSVLNSQVSAKSIPEIF